MPKPEHFDEKTGVDPDAEGMLPARRCRSGGRIRALILTLSALIGAVILFAAGCNGLSVPRSQVKPSPSVLRLATTTSTYDSGLLDAILPAFEAAYNAQVDVIAVGTGQALAIGARGDADVVLVHARAAEDRFVAQGHAVARYDVMYNDFVIVGPPADPAGIREAQKAAEAFQKIAQAQAPFASRGDDSGTHLKEQAIWRQAGLSPGADQPWYSSLGQGMGSTLTFANEQRAYALTDRGTFLSMQHQLPHLTILFGGTNIAENPDPILYNPYGVLPINPVRHPGVNGELALAFAQWLISPAVQEQIALFGVEQFGQPLFYPYARSK